MNKLVTLLTAFFAAMEPLKQYSVDIPVALKEFGDEKYAQGYAAKAAETGDPNSTPPVATGPSQEEFDALKAQVESLQVELSTAKDAAAQAQAVADKALSDDAIDKQANADLKAALVSLSGAIENGYKILHPETAQTEAPKAPAEGGDQAAPAPEQQA